MLYEVYDDEQMNKWSKSLNIVLIDVLTYEDWLDAP